MSLKSIFFYPPLTPAVYLCSPAEQLPYPLDDLRFATSACPMLPPCLAS